MPKVSVYLPEDLYRRAREKQLPISALVQEAIEAALSREATSAWVDRIRARAPLTTTEIDTAAVMDEVKDEWGT